MPNINEPQPREFSEDEVGRIIRRALKREPTDKISHRDLLETARAMGVDPEAVEKAIAEEQDEGQREALAALRERRRKAAFHAHLWSYIIISGFLLLLNLMTTPGVWWFQWPIFGWGIGLAFHFKETFWPSPNTLARERGVRRSKCRPGPIE